MQKQSDEQIPFRAAANGPYSIPLAPRKNVISGSANSLEVYEHIDDDIIRLVGTELSLATRPRTAGASAMAAALRPTLAAP